RLLALVVIVIAVVSFTLQREREEDPAYRGTSFRIQFAETSYRMIQARPWFGIGVGQYYPTSPLFFAPPLALAYGAENAHDYFLQLAAEIGMVGFTACAILLAGTAWLVAQRPAGPLRRADSIPTRARMPLARVTHTRAIDGLYEWESGKDGRRYRRTDEYASVFVEGNPRWAEIPMRAPREEHGETPVGVVISVEGIRGQRWLIGNDWTSVRIQLPTSKSPTLNVRRINIK